MSMTEKTHGQVVDTLTLRFTGEDENGVAIHELRAAHVAEVLQGLVGLASDFEKAGALGDNGPHGSEVLVRPAKEGSFLIEIVRIVSENWEQMVAVGGAAGVPSLGSIIWWATKSVRADVQDFTHLPNGNVRVVWQDNTAHEVPLEVWQELQKRDKRRKKHLRQLLTPLSDPKVDAVEVANPTDDVSEIEDLAPEVFTLTKPDYDAMKPEDEIEKEQRIFTAEAQMSAIDFDNPKKWRVKAEGVSRTASVEDNEFLDKVTRGRAIRKSDIFKLRIREDKTIKNGRAKTEWTVLLVEDQRRAAGDDV